MVILCACCNQPGDPSAVVPTIRTRCWLALPQVTRELYAHGGIDKPRVIQVARERNTSVRTVGGGRRA